MTAFNIFKTLKYDGYQRGLVSMVYQVFDEKSSGDDIKSKILLNQRPSDLPTQQLAEEIHKLIIKNSEKWKRYSSIKDNIWLGCWSKGYASNK